MTGSNSIYRSRQIKSGIALTLCTGATGLGLIFLVWILWTTLVNGLSALSLKLVTEMTPPPGEDGGLANAFAGSLMMVVLAVIIGTPIGILAGTYLAEFSRGKKIGAVIRFMYLGELVEYGPTSQIFQAPKNKRTEDYITGRYG